MIFTRTPLRISFFGGGTDYPAWFHENGGAVLSTSIDKYCNVTCRLLPQFFQHKHRIVYSRIENVNYIDQIEHPAVRAVLSWARVEKGLEIHHDGDLPVGSGLGSSSAFTVGLIKAIRTLNGCDIGAAELARDAIHVEQNIIGENVGSQDQISAAYGGFNRIEFFREGGVEVAPVDCSGERRKELNQHLMLFFTGVSRVASDVAKSQIDNFSRRKPQLVRMRAMVDEALEILRDNTRPITEFGELLHASWLCKRTLSDQVSTPEIDRLYDQARSAGVIGGKILGAGGGGFMLLFAVPKKQAAIRQRLARLLHVPFEFEDRGSRVVFQQPDAAAPSLASVNA